MTDADIEKRILKSRDSGHIKFLEMRCILENAFADYEERDDEFSKAMVKQLSETRAELMEKRQKIHLLVDSIF